MNDDSSINRYKIQNELRRRKKIKQRQYDKETCAKMFVIVSKFIDNYTKSKITGNDDHDDFYECTINGKENFNLVITSLESILRLMRRKRKNYWKAYNVRFLNQNQQQNQNQQEAPHQSNQFDKIIDEVSHSIITQQGQQQQQQFTNKKENTQQKTQMQSTQQTNTQLQSNETYNTSSLCVSPISLCSNSIDDDILGFSNF